MYILKFDNFENNAHTFRATFSNAVARFPGVFPTSTKVFRFSTPIVVRGSTDTNFD